MDGKTSKENEEKDENKEGNEIKEKLLNSDKNEEYNDYKLNYMKLQDEQNETENNK